MFVINILLYLFLYVAHCAMCRNLLFYYSEIDTFYLNIFDIKKRILQEIK